MRKAFLFAGVAAGLVFGVALSAAHAQPSPIVYILDEYSQAGRPAVYAYRGSEAPRMIRSGTNFFQIGAIGNSLVLSTHPTVASQGLFNCTFTRLFTTSQINRVKLHFVNGGPQCTNIGDGMLSFEDGRPRP